MVVDRYSVKVSRINESAHQSPYVTWTAHSVTVKPDGTLLIEGEKGSHVLSGGLWDGFELKGIR